MSTTKTPELLSIGELRTLLSTLHPANESILINHWAAVVAFSERVQAAVLEKNRVNVRAEKLEGVSLPKVFATEG